MAKKLPRVIYVYQCDETDGIPIYAVAQDIEEIPEDEHGNRIGIYVLKTQHTLAVSRSLK